MALDLRTGLLDKITEDSGKLKIQLQNPGYSFTQGKMRNIFAI